MASLIDELTELLQQEQQIYQQLIPVSEAKTQALVTEDLPKLQEITGQEQELLDLASAAGHHREEVIKNMGMVLNKAPKELDLSGLIALLAKQPEERTRLAALHDSLKSTMRRLVDVNEKNKSLLEASLEMIEYNMNFIQSTRMSPGNNNYDKNATSAGSASARYSPGSFDAKQ